MTQKSVIEKIHKLLEFHRVKNVRVTLLMGYLFYIFIFAN